MKEQTIVEKALTELNAALPASVSVRTAGGDSSASPPLCILKWSSNRLTNENGHTPHGGTIRDDYGDAIGRELHRYHEMELDVTMRAYDEADRDTWLSDVADHFLAFEFSAEAFHSDTTEWEVGSGEPRSNPVVEPDWYESGLIIRFKYMSRATQDADTLSTVQESVDGSTQ